MHKSISNVAINIDMHGKLTLGVINQNWFCVMDQDNLLAIIG